MPNRLMHSAAVLFLLAFAPLNSSISGDASAPAAQAKHGLTGSYYVSTLETHTDVNPTGQDWYVQVWMDPNDFWLPKPFTGPAAVRLDPQVAFGQGKGFVMQNGQRTAWWPTGFANPAGWTNPTAKPWEYLKAVIWKGYIRLPKAGTYYLTTASRGSSAVYLNQARVALNGFYGGVLNSDAFTYAKEDLRDYLRNLAYGREDLLFRAQPGAWSLSPSYVVPVTVETPRDVPIEVRHSIEGSINRDPTGIDLFWVTPDSPRDPSGKLVAQIVPSDVLYTEPPGPIEKPTVRSANSMVSADFLYFPAIRTDKDVTVTVRLADKDGNPVAGKRVHIGSLVSYGGADAIKQPEKPTNEKGETTAKIRPGAGYKVTHDSSIFATDVTDLVDVSQVAHVTFNAGTVVDLFFPDSFSPYYDPDLIKAEPLPLMAGRPVTISVALENRTKDAAELTATFKATALNIGAVRWPEIGRVEHIRLKPGEARRVGINWTPGQAQEHICLKVEVSVQFEGRAAGTSGGKVLTASAMPVAVWAQQGGAAPQNSTSAQGTVQRNIGAVAPEPGPCTFEPPPRYSGLIQKGEEAGVWGPLPYRPPGILDCKPDLAQKLYCRDWAPSWFRGADHYRHLALIEDDVEQSKKDADLADFLSYMGFLYIQCWHDPLNSSYQRVVPAPSDSPAGYVQALTKSMERYQGAQSDGDRESMANQATAMQLYEKRLAEALRRDADDLQKRAEKLPPDDTSALAKRQANGNELFTRLRQGRGFTSHELSILRQAGFSEQDIKGVVSRFTSLKEPPPIKGAREQLLGHASLYRQSADDAEKLASAPVTSDAEKPSHSFSRSYVVGNPHDKEEKIELFIRPITIPPAWKLSIGNADQVEPGGKLAPQGKPPQFPVREVEPGKHYAVTLPPKTEIKVGSVLVPKSELGANTTARWAVEGKIGDELIGGMVHEMNVPYVVADLKVPPVGSKEQEEESPRLPSKGLPSAVLIAIAAGLVLVIAIVVFVILKRRRRPGAPTGQ